MTQSRRQRRQSTGHQVGFEGVSDAEGDRGGSLKARGEAMKNPDLRNHRRSVDSCGWCGVSDVCYA